MPINPVPDRSEVVVGDEGKGELNLRARSSWVEFFRSAFYALFGWKRSYTALLTFDFGNIVAGGEATTTVSVVGARAGDLVSVSSKTKVVGLGVDGFILANDVATIRRFNYSLGAIDPASDDFRCVVLQQ